MRVQSFITPETERDGGGQRVRGGDMEKEEQRRERMGREWERERGKGSKRKGRRETGRGLKGQK